MADFIHRIQKANKMKAIRVVFASLGLIGIVAACSSANFGSSNTTPTKSDNSDGAPGGAPGTTPGSSATGPADTSAPGSNPGGTSPGGSVPDSTPGGPAACTTDQVKLDWTGDEKACIESGKTWNYDSSSCVEIRKATFDCTWTNAIAELDKKGLTTPTIKADSAAGAKLVSCGQAQDGNRIVIQWIKVADGAAQVACNGGSSPLQHHVTTGCYTYYANGTVPAAATTQAEKDARVYACLGSI